MLQLSASLTVLKGIVRYTNAFLSSGQGADTTVASLNWEINGFGENFAVSIIVLYRCASPCNCIWKEHLLSIAPWRNWVTFFGSTTGSCPVSGSPSWASQRLLSRTGEQSVLLDSGIQFSAEQRLSLVRGSDGRGWRRGDPLTKTPLVQRLWATCHDQSKSFFKEPLGGQMCVSVLLLAQHNPRKKHYLSPNILSETRHKLATLL